MRKILLIVAALLASCTAAIPGYADSGLVSGLAGRLANAPSNGARAVAYQSPLTGSVARAVQDKFDVDDPISFRDFGAKCDGTTDDGPAWDNFYAAVLMTHRAGHMPAGTCKIGSAKTLDLASIAPKGVYLYGDAQYGTVLDFSSNSAGHVAIVDTGNAGGGAFYSTFRDFGIKCNIAGPCLQLGHLDASDALNEFTFQNFWVGNVNTSASAVAIQSNYVLNTHFLGVIAANNGHGDAWQLTATAFSDWVGGSGTYADNGFHWMASGVGCSCGAIAGNTFIGLDMEVNAVNHVKIDTANAHDNTWIGGTMVYTAGTSYGIQSTAGSQNLFTGIFLNVSGGASYSNFFNGGSAVGVALLNMFGMSPGLAVGNPSFSAYLSGNQTLTAGTWTKLTFNTTDFQNGTAFSTSGNNFTAPFGGRFAFDCLANINATNASAGTGYVGLYRNGSNVRAAGFGIPAGTNFEAGMVSATLALSPGDAVDCRASIPASSGSPVVSGGSTNSYFDAHYVGP